MRARVVALLGAVTLTTGLAGVGAEAQVVPHVDVIAPPDTVDEHPLVRLVGFPAGSYVVSICGNDGRNGSADCDLLGADGFTFHGRDLRRGTLGALVLGGLT